MKLLSIKLNGIKKFNRGILCEFEDSYSINTISGKNGSGKTTIFESLMLLQKAYFVKQLNNAFINTYKDKDILDFVGEELFEFVKGEGSYIEAKFCFDSKDFNLVNKLKLIEVLDKGIIVDKDEPYEVEVRLEVTEVFKEKTKWEINTRTEEQKEVLDLFWNYSDPKNIVTYISAERTVEEDNLNFKDIKLVTDLDIAPILRFILEPNKIYGNLYMNMINDYLYQRIIPRQPRKDLYFINAKTIFSKLVTSLTISNFTGKIRENQFILQAINDEGGKFDIRKFSSGEKLVWYTILLLNYIGNIGVLIIDEPENHLHEELSWKFVKLLDEISNSASNMKEIDDLILSQVYLITHSKNLIYNNFTNGANYVVNEGGVEKIDYQTCEKTLRRFGLSYTKDKILFVEGDTDVSLLEKIIGIHNIQVRALGNCAEIIRTFEGLKRVRSYLLDPRFVFLIDRDTRDDRTIEELREKDEEYFDQHFVIMPKHELENYFLDEINIKVVIDEIQAVLGETRKIEASDILSIIYDYAMQQLPYTQKKYMNTILRNKLNTIESIVKQKDLKIDSFQEHKEYINNLFMGDAFNRIKDDMGAVYTQMQEIYSNENWETNWKVLMDGKSVFNLTMAQLARELGVAKDVLVEKVKCQIISDEKSELNILVSRILNLFNS